MKSLFRNTEKCKKDLYSTGLPGLSVWRSVQRVRWTGVKSRFSNKSMGEPVFFTFSQDDLR